MLRLLWKLLLDLVLLCCRRFRCRFMLGGLRLLFWWRLLFLCVVCRFGVVVVLLVLCCCFCLGVGWDWVVVVLLGFWVYVDGLVWYCCGWIVVSCGRLGLGVLCRVLWCCRCSCWLGWLCFFVCRLGRYWLVWWFLGYWDGGGFWRGWCDGCCVGLGYVWLLWFCVLCCWCLVWFLV